MHHRIRQTAGGADSTCTDTHSTHTAHKHHTYLTHTALIQHTNSNTQGRTHTAHTALGWVLVSRHLRLYSSRVMGASSTGSSAGGAAGQRWLWLSAGLCLCCAVSCRRKRRSGCARSFSSRASTSLRRSGVRYLTQTPSPRHPLHAPPGHCLAVLRPPQAEQRPRLAGHRGGEHRGPGAGVPGSRRAGLSWCISPPPPPPPVEAAAQQIQLQPLDQQHQHDHQPQGCSVCLNLVNVEGLAASCL